MRKEVFRMERVTCKEKGLVMLEDFNLNIWEGEIMGLIPGNSFGLHSFIQLLMENVPLEDGYIFYHEELINSWKGGKKGNNRITVIQDRSCLVDGLTVADNVFVLRQGFRKNIIQPAVLEIQLEPFIKEIGIELSAGTYVDKLTSFERVVVEILKGIVAGHRLIILSEMSALLGVDDLKKLYRIIRYYASKGYSFIYIGTHIEDLLQFCDRTALMSNGHIEKILQPRDMKFDKLHSISKEYDKMIHKYLENRKDKEISGPSICDCYCKTQNMKYPLTFGVREGECLVLQCLDNTVYRMLLQQLVGENTNTSWRMFLHGKKAEIPGNRHIALLQEQCNKTMLFPELSYMDNLCFNLDKRIRHVWTTGRIRKSIRQEYGEILGEDVFKLSVDELTEKQKYQLVYSRILLQKPEIVFCMQPFKGADLTHRMYIWRLLEQLLRKGIAVIILAVNLSDVLSLADRLICIDKEKEHKEYKQSEFASVSVLEPWLQLYGTGKSVETADDLDEF
ncbi:MAG: sugar ABC transporter ATP-binding protein [Lachnospiraceae bacterium]|nr:sugar ABC transporter ATP-binding protein [Lachnospiraceae bacterium]